MHNNLDRDDDLGLVFDMIDHNGDGVLSLKEMASSIRNVPDIAAALGFSPGRAGDNAILEQELNEMEFDELGYVSKHDFITHFYSHVPHATPTTRSPHRPAGRAKPHTGRSMDIKRNVKKIQARVSLVDN